MRVFIVRHAEAKPGKPDALRPLTEDGRAAARALGERLRGEPIANAAQVEPRADDRLAPGATVDDLRAVLTGIDGAAVVVGHQPDCGEIVLALTGRSQPFPPAGVAELDL